MRRASEHTPEELAAIEAELKTPWPQGLMFVPYFRAASFHKETAPMIDPLAAHAEAQQNFYASHRPEHASAHEQAPVVAGQRGVTTVLRDDRQDAARMARETTVEPEPRVVRQADGAVVTALSPDDPGVTIRYEDMPR